MTAGRAGVPAAWLAARFTTAGVSGCMTTRAGGCSGAPFDTLNLRHGADAVDAVDANRAILAAAIGARPVYLEQLHGTRVVRVGAADVRPGAPVHAADASVTTEPGIACTVLTADCLPVLFAAPDGRAVGAAHAGWRGLAAGLLEATLQAVGELAACAPGDVEVWLGACIGPRRFEVGADVLAAFGAAPTLSRVPTADRPARFVPLREGKWLANLPLLARDRLQAAGVTRVDGVAACTVADASRFFSFRRDRVTGRMASAVWVERGNDR